MTISRMVQHAEADHERKSTWRNELEKVGNLKLGGNLQLGCNFLRALNGYRIQVDSKALTAMMVCEAITKPTDATSNLKNCLPRHEFLEWWVGSHGIMRLHIGYGRINAVTLIEGKVSIKRQYTI
jgi:hypothetical protein